jgi:hypothetical protein
MYDEDRSENTTEAIDHVASAVRFGLKWLGTGDAGTPMGALEAHGSMVLDGAQRIANSLGAIASAIEDLAQAVRETEKDQTG